MADKPIVEILPVKIVKIWDKAMAKPASEALSAAVGKAVGGKAKLVKKAGKDEAGLRILLTVNELAFEEKGAVLSARIKGNAARLPEDSHLADLTGNGKVPGANPKKIEADVKALLDSIGADMGAKIATLLGKI